MSCGVARDEKNTANVPSANVFISCLLHLDRVTVVQPGGVSNLIKTGGANVSPIEIQDQLTRYPGMRAGLVVGVPHPVLGEIIVLCAVPTEGHSLDPKEIESFLRERLAAFKRPKLVLIFDADDLSFTGNQKIQVGPLRELALARMRALGVEVDGVAYS